MVTCYLEKQVSPLASEATRDQTRPCFNLRVKEVRNFRLKQIVDFFIFEKSARMKSKK